MELGRWSTRAEERQTPDRPVEPPPVELLRSEEIERLESPQAADIKQGR